MAALPPIALVLRSITSSIVRSTRLQPHSAIARANKVSSRRRVLVIQERRRPERDLSKRQRSNLSTKAKRCLSHAACGQLQAQEDYGCASGSVNKHQFTRTLVSIRVHSWLVHSAIAARKGVWRIRSNVSRDRRRCVSRRNASPCLPRDCN